MKTTIRVLLIILFAVFLVHRWDYWKPGEKKPQKEFYPDGTIKAVHPYDAAGRLNGVAITYYPNGNKKSEATYKNNLREGASKEYYENGQLQSECNYKNGKAEGINNLYYENGTLAEECTYKDGQKDGIQRNYYPNGALYLEWHYRNDQNNITLKVYYESGELQAEFIFKDGNPLSAVCFDKKGVVISCDELFAEFFDT